MPYDEERAYTVVPDTTSTEVRAGQWAMAKGLQAVDGLQVSDYAEQVARRYVAGQMEADQATDEVLRAYADSPGGRQQEADVVAMRINQLLAQANGARFDLRPKTLLLIHRNLFRGQLEDHRWEGAWRTCNIEKVEPVLGGRSVPYMPYAMIADALEYDFEQERSRRYELPLDQVGLDRFVRFVAGVWQIHPFREGNTRTVAVFSQLYLRHLGIPADNGQFLDNSLFYRDALVRASYSSIADGIDEDYGFIRAFYRNVALGAGQDLATMDLNVHGIRAAEHVDLPYRDPSGY